MNLYLTDSSPINAKFTNADGLVLYKVDTPMKLVGRRSTITRVVPNDVLRKSDEADFQDRFVPLAEIEYRVIGSSVIRFAGTEVETKTYFRKEGYGLYGAYVEVTRFKDFGPLIESCTGHRVFAGPDGKEYRWMLGLLEPELTINNDERTPVARFHRKNLFFSNKFGRACLEILPAGQHMVDTIVVTFVYIEKIRKERERMVTHPRGGGGP